MGYIYKITTQYSNKVYIGQTRQALTTRFNQHKNRDKGTKLAQAFDKYGRENFTIDLIEEVENDKLNDREIYWIEYYNSFKHGYNMTIGGFNIEQAIEASKKAVEQRDKDTFQVLQVFESLSDASRSLGLEDHGTGNLAKCCKKEIHEAYGYRWNYVGDEPDTTRRGFLRRIPVYMRDLKTQEIIRTFDSAKSASQFLNKINGSQITACCKGRIPQAYGYKWSYVNE